MITLGRIAAVDPVRLIAIFVLGVFASWFMPRLRIGGIATRPQVTDFTDHLRADPGRLDRG